MEKVIDGIEFIVRVIIFAFTTLLWAIIGFLFWCVLLLRGILGLITHVFLSAFSQRRNKAIEINNQLHTAVAFYPNGFSIIVDIIFKRVTETMSFSESFSFIRFVQEIVIAMFFWASLLGVHYLWSYPVFDRLEQIAEKVKTTKVDKQTSEKSKEVSLIKKTVQVPKCFFYQKPNTTDILQSYLIYGDTVIVIEDTFNFYYKVKYQNPKDKTEYSAFVQKKDIG